MDNASIIAEVQEIIADTLDQPDLTVTTATTAEDVEGWDSFNHINIVLAIEARFGIRMSTAEFEDLKNVGDVVAAIERKRRALA